MVGERGIWEGLTGSSAVVVLVCLAGGEEDNGAGTILIMKGRINRGNDPRILEHKVMRTSRQVVRWSASDVEVAQWPEMGARAFLRGCAQGRRGRWRRRTRGDEERKWKGSWWPYIGEGRRERKGGAQVNPTTLSGA